MYKKYRYLLWGAVGITSILLILKVIFKISFVFDKVNCFLYFLIPIIWIPYHYIKRECKFKGSVVIKMVIKYSILLIIIKLTLSSEYANYKFITSPQKTHKVVIKEYNTGFHHLTAHLEIYEVIGGIFKRDTGGRIQLSERDFKMDEQEIKLWARGSEDEILIQWKGEDQLHIFLEGGKEAIAETNIYGNDRYETIIKWHN